MITLTQIYNEILLKEQNKKMVENKNEDNWKPERCMDYSPPEFCVPVSRAKAAQRRKFSKVLAFIKRVRNIRYGEGCTIMPIPTTSRSMIAIAGSAANVSNLIKFMCAIGLISVECSKYQFNSRYEKCNFSKKYRYYYDNEVKIIDYCEREPIKEFVPKNHPDRKLNDLPMPLISFKSVSFSARLNLVKPSDISAAEFEKCISELLFRKYPDLEKYQMLADEINETYYAQYPELAIRFIPRFTWYKDKPAIRKIGIRATNQCVSASNSDTPDNRMSKRELLDKYGLNLSKDVKSSVPRITLSLNQHLWEKESTDIYERIYQEYIHSIGCPTSGTVVQKFEELRPAIKTLHMRRYFDSEGEIGNHTCHAMANVENRQEVYAEMSRYQKAIIEAEGRKLYGNEIFFHESCIYLDVLKELLDNGFFCWECYDAFYARKEGITQEAFERYVEALVEKKANAYIQRYYEIKDETVAS